jgi:uncharacterized protein YyaL (SSP411 family)
MFRYHDGAPHITGLLGDQAQTARALLDAAEATGDQEYNDRARQLADLMEARFRDAENGGFWDVWDVAGDVGRIRDRQKSVQDNAVCAEVFLRLHHLTHEQRFLDIARSTLESFAEVAPQMGHFAAAYAKQVDLVLHPPATVNIVGVPSSVEEMHWSALSLDVPFRVVQVLHPLEDAERLAALSLPAEPSPATYVCVGTACSAPATDADELRTAVQTMAETQQVALGD